MISWRPLRKTLYFLCGFFFTAKYAKEKTQKHKAVNIFKLKDGIKRVVNGL